MIYNSAIEYYFWEGIKAAVFGQDKAQKPSSIGRPELVKRCLQAYSDGYDIGLLITFSEYQELFR